MGSGSTLPQDLSAPSQVIAEALDENSFQVCWTPAAGDLKVEIHRQAFGEVGSKYVITLAPGQTCYTDDHAFRSGFVYWVKHVSLDGLHESPWALSAPVVAPNFYQWTTYLPVFLK